MTSPNRSQGAPDSPAAHGSHPPAGIRNPQLAEPPVGALDARLVRAFRLLGVRSAPAVSMLYSRARPRPGSRMTGRVRERRR